MRTLVVTDKQFEALQWAIHQVVTDRALEPQPRHIVGKIRSLKTVQNNWGKEKHGDS